MSRTKRLTETEKMQIVREAAEGVSMTELATQFGMTVRAVRYVLKAAAERRQMPPSRSLPAMSTHPRPRRKPP
jgi:transposase-like protein